MDINFPPSQIRFCNDTVPLQSGLCNEPISINQRLAGHEHPKTNIRPIVAAPSHDLNAWKTSDLTIHSHINKKSHFDTSRSGYGCDSGCNSHESIEHYTPTEMAHRDWDNHHHWYHSQQQQQPCSSTSPTLMGEPIQSNLGISQVLEFDDQKDHGKSYDEKSWIEPERDQLFDPRFTGYGTFYRYYWNDEKNRPDYFYKDIDAITMPLIHRSKIDTFPWAASNEEQIRLLANTDFMESSLLFRNEMQDRLMRKRNAEWWQRRVAPITTMVK